MDFDNSHSDDPLERFMPGIDPDTPPEPLETPVGFDEVPDILAKRVVDLRVKLRQERLAAIAITRKQFQLEG
jgi:hypothetical protein